MPRLRGNTMARNWCFTAFNNIHLNENIDKINYYIYQKEKTKEGKLHLQGYIQLKDKLRLNQVLDIVGHGNHIEKARGKASDNIKYCTKLESRVEEPVTFGVAKNQGDRTDIDTACKLAIENKWDEIEDSTYVKYYKGLHKLAALKQKPAERKVDVACFWGNTGKGKSHLANQEMPQAYWKPSGVWWDGYMGQKDIIIDDFEPDVDCSVFLRWIDKWPLQVPIKGGFVTLQAERIIITTHFNPEELYPNRKEEVMRRIKKVIHME